MIKLGKYRHFKGNEYEVLDIATHSETLEPMVVYRLLYGERKLWVRPASMWEEIVEMDGKLVHRFTYITALYTNDLSRLWYDGDEQEWEKALDHYYEICRNAELEDFLEKLKPEIVKQMPVSEFYQFLYDKYFVWKYTAKNRLATTRNNLKKYLDNNELNELRKIQSKIFSINTSDSLGMLDNISDIKGLGIAGASGLLSVLFPEQYGTVDQFVVQALLTIDKLPENDSLSNMKPNFLSLKDGVILEEILRNKALELNQKFQTDKWTPRKIDMILWSYGR